MNNQEVGFCLAHEDYGVQCGVASTGDSGTSAEEFRSYWFSTDIIDSIKDDTPLDPWDSAYDDNMIDDYYFGLTQYYLRMASSTILVGDKFQFKEVTNEVQWSNVDDYRFMAGDTINLYRLQESDSVSYTHLTLPTSDLV